MPIEVSDLQSLPAGFAVGFFLNGERGAEDAVERRPDELGIVDDQNPLAGLFG
jgi:hypothetical protein